MFEQEQLNLYKRHADFRISTTTFMKIVAKVPNLYKAESLISVARYVINEVLTKMDSDRQNPDATFWIDTHEITPIVVLAFQYAAEQRMTLVQNFHSNTAIKTAASVTQMEEYIQKKRDKVQMATHFTN